MTGDPPWAALQADPMLAFPREAWTETRCSPEVARLRERLLTQERQIDTERALLTTESYRESEGQPMAIRRARMLLHLARGTTIAIHPDERIVGNRSPWPRMGVIAPEGAVQWVDGELEILSTRPQDRFNVAPEQIRLLRERVFPYWRGKTLEDRVAVSLPEEVAAAMRGYMFAVHQTDHAQGHILPDVAAWLRLGIRGLREKVQRAYERADPRDEAKRAFYQAAEIALQAAQEFIGRYAVLAGQQGALAWQAAEADDSGGTRFGNRGYSDQAAEACGGGEARSGNRGYSSAAGGAEQRKELLRIAGTCGWLAEYPPRTFREALQALWFLLALLQMESNASSFSPGRLDQYMLPFLERDLASGALTLSEAQDLLEHLWLKFNEIVLLRSSASARYFAGFPIGFNIALGGQRADGSDATNPLSIMCLRAQADVGLTQPNLSLRIHRDSPQELLLAASLCIGRGGGMPQVFSDEAIIPGQAARGVAPQDALNYAIVGCVELSTPGKALGWSDAGMCNMARVLELTLYGGRDPQTGESLGLPTPRLDEMGDFAALEAAYDRQLAHAVALMIRGCNVVDRLHAELLPSPFLSLVVDDCIERGLDVTAGGAHYNFSGVQGVQIANVADSLAAIRQLVFEHKRVSATTLLDALRQNYAGYEALRQQLIAEAPKYGNDDPLVDDLAARWAERYAALVSEHRNVRGGMYQPGFYTVSAHVPMGAHVGATPDGRRAGEPLADGGVSPMAGRDARGPTAVLRSVGRLGLGMASNGTLLNMKFLPSLFATEDGLASFVALLRTFCRLEIPHVQFNVVSEATLRDAQAHPERYRRLVVRVAGYSAYFTELDRALQDEIIRRTEFARVG
jgi:pyruvate formate-lyase/glycerol dehydratase family glycyl radical enzyme